MRLPLLLAAAALAASCGDAGETDDAETGGSFIAFNRDFADFRAWPRTSLGAISAGGHLEGVVQFAYVRGQRPEGSREFPVGTIIVRALQQGETPQQWSLFAMAKRGGTYNSRGAAGWEFFRLRVDARDQVQIIARGLNPQTGLEDPYVIGDGTGCNTCHGLADARDYDSVLSPALRPPDR